MVGSSKNTNLHGYREVTLSLRREEHIHCLLLEWGVALGGLTNLDYVQLQVNTKVTF